MAEQNETPTGLGGGAQMDDGVKENSLTPMIPQPEQSVKENSGMFENDTESNNPFSVSQSMVRQAKNDAGILFRDQAIHLAAHLYTHEPAEWQSLRQAVSKIRGISVREWVAAVRAKATGLTVVPGSSPAGSPQMIGDIWASAPDASLPLVDSETVTYRPDHVGLIKLTQSGPQLIKASTLLYVTHWAQDINDRETTVELAVESSPGVWTKFSIDPGQLLEPKTVGAGLATAGAVIWDASATAKDLTMAYAGTRDRQPPLPATKVAGVQTVDGVTVAVLGQDTWMAAGAVTEPPQYTPVGHQTPDGKRGGQKRSPLRTGRPWSHNADGSLMTSKRPDGIENGPRRTIVGC